ncbi:uncharacterized protein LOC134851543 isoform X2 [Symsagittifera roscoffensis]
MTQVNLIFQSQLNQTGASNIPVTESDFNTMETSIPDFTLKTTHCSVKTPMKINIKQATMDGSFLPAHFTTGSEDCDTDGNSFLKACLNSNASFQCSAQAVFGQYIFWNHNCDFVWETTAHIDSLKWSGLMELKAAISAIDPKIVPIDNQPELQFGFNLTLSFKPKNWVIDEVSVSQCDIMLVGLKIGSYCGTVASIVEENFQPVLDKWSNFEADTMITILEQATNKKVGDPVSIPVRVVNE